MRKRLSKTLQKVYLNRALRTLAENIKAIASSTNGKPIINNIPKTRKTKIFIPKLYPQTTK